jgi:DNA-binding HxlR family transcriptional regulator
MYDYGEACPISKATQVLCERWTLQIVREMMLGASRFSEFQKYLPKISPSLLTSRLKLLVDNGIAIRKRTPEKRGFEYHLTAAGKQLKPVLDALGNWGMAWVFDSKTDVQLDTITLMRHLAETVKVDQLPDCNTVLQFTLTDVDEPQKQFVLVHGDKCEYCDENPGYEVDVYFRCTLRDLSAVWWGEIGIPAALESGKIKVTGPPAYTRNIAKWFPQSMFAGCNPRRLDGAAIRALERR